MSHLPRYSLIGLAIVAISETAMLLQIDPFWTWHTPIAWTGYLLFVDGVVWSRRGSSWLTDAPAEFAFLAVMSIPLWLIFEAYNLCIQNWHYINLPPNVVVRYASYAWAFATIWPGIFETAELIATFRRSAPVERTEGPAATVHQATTGGRWATVSIIAGAAMLLWPIVQPSPYLAAPVWLGFIFLLDPINARLGAESLIGDFRSGSRDRLTHLVLSGFACGVLWEFWNYWARSKWIYTVPIMEHPKIFEMPLPGYLGFPAFALECFTMYVFVRHVLWRSPTRPIAV
jgi:hypothetical protein